MSAPRTWTLTVDDDGGKRRLDQFLAARLEADGVSRERVKGWIAAGGCVVDGRVVAKPGEKLRGGERVELTGATEPTEVEPEAGPLDVLFADERLLVLDKPAGLTVHPAPSCPEGTLVHRLAHSFPQLRAMEGMRPGIVHRLDKDTSGLIVVALDEAARQALSAAFAERRVRKTYLAVVRGVPRCARILEEPIGRHPTRKTKMAVVPESEGGRPARTEWRSLYADPGGRFSLLAVTIRTGRTHQIRVHLSHAGHPIVGDALYGGMRNERDPLLKKLARRQLLHAAFLRFAHPATGGELSFSCPPPGDFLRAMLRLSRRAQRVVVTGNPGSGKSTLTALLAASGLPACSADAVVRELYEPGGDAARMLRARFGARFAVAGTDPDAEDAPVDRAALFAAMRADEGLRREVMDMVHPMVRHRMAVFEAAHADARAVVHEVPLALETGWGRRAGGKADTAGRAGREPGRTAADDAEWGRADVLVGVACPLEERRARLFATRGWDAETFAVMESWQWPAEKKLAACDVVADNSGPREDLAREARRVLAELAGRRRARMRALARRLAALLADDLEETSGESA